jgi:hypothetical protein
VKNVTATLADGILPGVNFSPNEPASTQSKLPVCTDVTTYLYSTVERVIVFELTAGVRILKGQVAELSKRDPTEFESQVIGTIEATFFVSFNEALDDGFLDDDCLAHFAVANVPFNAWPYWRELVQSACSRLGLPRLVLPTHRLLRRHVNGVDATQSPPSVRALTAQTG